MFSWFQVASDYDAEVFYFVNFLDGLTLYSVLVIVLRFGIYAQVFELAYI